MFLWQYLTKLCKQVCVTCYKQKNIVFFVWPVLKLESCQTCELVCQTGGPQKLTNLKLMFMIFIWYCSSHLHSNSVGNKPYPGHTIVNSMSKNTGERGLRYTLSYLEADKRVKRRERLRGFAYWSKRTLSQPLLHCTILSASR